MSTNNVYRFAMQQALDAITRRYEYVEAANILRAAIDATTPSAPQANWKNRAELLQEDIESFHLAMDGLGVPRVGEGGAAFSMYGRALRLVDKDGVVALVKQHIAQTTRSAPKAAGATGCEWDRCRSHGCDGVCIAQGTTPAAQEKK